MKVLDHGFVELKDTMGTDTSIVEAARVSYDIESTKHTSSDEGLIRYLYRHKHTTPFEMCEMKFHIKMPIFVARQWIRHRTASINEVSGRYSVIRDEFHKPENVRAQSQTNKQGSDGLANVSDLLEEDWNTRTQKQFDVYNDLIQNNAAREQARIHLPLSTYTAFYWKVDLHNLLHFLKLRTDLHAQYEIRVFADAIEEVVAEKFPLAYRAWVDYSKEAYNLSRMEIGILKSIIMTIADSEEKVSKVGNFIMNLDVPMSKRERQDFLSVLNIEAE